MAGWLVARGGIVRAFLISMAVAIVGLLLLVADSLPLVLAGLAAVAIGTFAAQAAVSGFVDRAAEGDRAAASGLYLASYYLGGLVGALLVGQVFALAGWSASVLVVVAAAALSGIFALRLKAPGGAVRRRLGGVAEPREEASS